MQPFFLLLDEVKRCLTDIAAGRTEDANTAIARLHQGWRAGRSVDVIALQVLRYTLS
jgi:hypothetical protein